MSVSVFSVKDYNWIEAAKLELSRYSCFHCLALIAHLSHCLANQQFVLERLAPNFCSSLNSFRRFALLISPARIGVMKAGLERNALPLGGGPPTTWYALQTRTPFWIYISTRYKFPNHSPTEALCTLEFAIHVTVSLFHTLPLARSIGERVCRIKRRRPGTQILYSILWYMFPHQDGKATVWRVHIVNVTQRTQRLTDISPLLQVNYKLQIKLHDVEFFRR